MIAREVNVPDIFRLLLREFSEKGAGQHFRKADDRVERGAQFMAHIGHELALGAVRHHLCLQRQALRFLHLLSRAYVPHVADIQDAVLLAPFVWTIGYLQGSGRHQQIHREAGAVGAQAGGFIGPGVQSAVLGLAQVMGNLPADAALVGRRAEDVDFGADDFIGLITEQAKGGVVGVDDLALIIGDDDAATSRLQHLADQGVLMGKRPVLEEQSAFPGRDLLDQGADIDRHGQQHHGREVDGDPEYPPEIEHDREDADGPEREPRNRPAPWTILEVGTGGGRKPTDHGERDELIGPTERRPHLSDIFGAGETHQLSDRQGLDNDIEKRYGGGDDNVRKVVPVGFLQFSRLGRDLRLHDTHPCRLRNASSTATPNPDDLMRPFPETRGRPSLINKGKITKN